MALFSDIDWIILLGVGAFLLFGPENKAVLRQLGRWYGRLARLKQEMLSEVTKAAELPLPVPGQATSIRSMLLSDVRSDLTRWSGIPAAVSSPPVAARAAAPAFVGADLGSPVWTSTIAAPATVRGEVL